MEKSKMTNFCERVIRCFYILIGITFLPVLFCVFFLDKHIKYNEGLHPATVLPNAVLLVIALAGVAVVCLFARALRKVELTAKVNIITDIVLAGLFVLLYFINVWIAREIVFRLPWDIMVVTTHASYVAEGNAIGYQPYFSIYTNNIPIVYILKELFTRAMENPEYPYVNDFIWVQTNCVLLSLGGFFGCLTIKKLTRKFAPTLIYFMLYLALIGLTPWKIAPYTDTYGMIFPIMCVYFYLCYRDAEKAVWKFLFMALTLVSAAAGGLVKPSIYILLIAILMVELISFVQKYKEKWKYLLFEAVLIAGLFFIKGICVDYMIEDIGLDFNEELGAGWQHYFRMGQNEETTGSYSTEDAALFGEFQENKQERNEAALERALARVREKGFFGNISFGIRKMVMVFNEGTFGWANEVEIRERYPLSIARNDRITEFLRNVFWPDMPYTGRLNTFCQLVWIFCLVGMAGFCFLPGTRRENCVLLAVSFLGIYFYQLLFEARARYLMVFLPLLVVVSVCGLWQYVEWAVNRLAARRGEVPDSKAECAGARGHFTLAAVANMLNANQ